MNQTVTIQGRLSPVELALELPVGEMPETTYVGGWTPIGRTVFVHDGDELRVLSLAGPGLVRGYGWGRIGSGPRETARAILLDATGSGALAGQLCRPYTWEVVSKLPPEGFRLSQNEVLAWVEH